jgi:hypothetical protein
MAFVFETKRNCIVDKLLKIIKLIYMKNALCLILDNFDIVGFLIFARIPVDSSHFSLHFNSILSPKTFFKAQFNPSLRTNWRRTEEGRNAGSFICRAPHQLILC